MTERKKKAGPAFENKDFMRYERDKGLASCIEVAQKGKWVGIRDSAKPNTIIIVSDRTFAGFLAATREGFWGTTGMSLD